MYRDAIEALRHLLETGIADVICHARSGPPPYVRGARRMRLVWGIYAVRIREADWISEIIDLGFL